MTPAGKRRFVRWMTVIIAGLSVIGWSPSVDAQGTPASMIGRSSCAASTCHGNSLDRGEPWRHAMSVWAAKDPHADAASVLMNELSQQIVFLLDSAIAKKHKDGDASWSLDRDNLLRQRCISCHATSTAADCQESAQPLDLQFIAEGVSCEACHGAAGSWVDSHYAMGFAESSQADVAQAQLEIAAQKAAVGMRDTESIVGRAATCVRCHVGSRSEDGMIRDMNHDIIAAGHPVLRFDLLLYVASLPQHWEVTESSEFHAAPIRVRQAGRAATLAAAAKLASERAQAHVQQASKEWSERSVPWPEFSDYDCFACHQTLSMDQYVLPPSSPGSTLRISDGLPIWNSWHTVAQQDLTKEQLTILAPNHVDAAQMATVGQNIAAKFATVAKADAQADFEAPKYLQSVRARLPRAGSTEVPVPRDWHEAAIIYLDVEAALRQMAQRDDGSGGFAKIHQQFVSDVQGFLQFNRGFNSPASFNNKTSQEFTKKVIEVIDPLSNNQPNVTN